MVDYGLSVRQLAQTAGVTERTVRRWKKRGEIPEPYKTALQTRLGAHNAIGKDAWAGWQIYQNLLISPEGDKYTQADIRSAPLYREAIKAYRRGHVETQENTRIAKEICTNVDAVVTALAYLMRASDGLRASLPKTDLNAPGTSLDKIAERADNEARHRAYDLARKRATW
jgi:Fe-S cluster biosynthesis and repair protein YggX